MPSSARPTITVEIDFTSGALNETGISWVDVSQYVKGSIRYSWGREKSVDEFQPGRGSFTLDNRSGLFDPSNSSGTYYGLLKPRRKVRIRAFGDGAAGHLPVAGFCIASGWIQGWPQRIVSRKLVEVDIQFDDFMAVAARLPMPDSAYDWQIKQTAPYAWYKLNDPTFTAIDSSGNNRHGQWQVYEGFQQPWQGMMMPTQTLKAGETDPVIAATGRPGRSWAAMQADIGQPLGGVPTTSAPRTPVLVTHRDTANLLADDFSIEMWVKIRQAFPLNITNSYTGTSPMLQPLVTWGNPGAGGAYGGVRYELDLSETSFAPFLFTFRTTGSGSGIGYDATDDGSIHQIVFVYDKASPTLPALAVYVDGVLRHNYYIDTITSATGFDASGRNMAVIGQATGLPEGLQSTLGDIVFWNRLLSGAEVLKNYRAGQYGNLEVSGTAPLTVPYAFTHAFEMAGAGLTPYFVNQSATPLQLLPGSLKGKTLADHLRQIAASEQGNLFWDPGALTWGRMTLWDRNWPIYDTSAALAPIASPSDASGATFGYSQVDYRDGSDLIANDVTVSFSAGEQRVTNATSIADYGSVAGSVTTILVSQEQAFQVASYRVWKYGQPPTSTIVPEHVVIEPTTLNEFNVMARARPQQRLTLVRTRPDNTTFTDDYWIDGVTQEIDAPAGGLWRTTLTVSPADDPANAKPFVFGTSTFGGTDVFWL